MVNTNQIFGMYMEKKIYIYHILTNAVTVTDIPTKFPSLLLLWYIWYSETNPQQKVKAKLFKICAAHRHSHFVSLPSLSEEQ